MGGSAEVGKQATIDGAYLKDCDIAQEFGFCTKVMKKLFDINNGSKKEQLPLFAGGLFQGFAPSTDMDMVPSFFSATRGANT
ncbi:MAG: hypothetical protein ACRER3_23185 [Pseudomonas fluorescens]